MALRLLIAVSILSLSLWIIFSLDILILCIILNCLALTALLMLLYQFIYEEDVSRGWERERTEALKKLFDEKKNQEG